MCAVVTGANSGIGVAACEALAARGARVVMCVRSPQRAAEAISRVREAAPEGGDASVAVVTISQAPSPPPEQCELARRKFEMQTSKGFDQEWKHGFINDLTLYGPYAIVGSDQEGTLNYRIAQWMMSDEVRKALHVEDAPQSQWPGPAAGWTYASNYSACNAEAPAGAPSMTAFYADVAPRVSGRVLVFNGDTDPCVSYEGTRDAIEHGVGFDRLEGGTWRPWFYNATADSAAFIEATDILYGPLLSTIAAGPQLAGLTMDFEHDLSFATVHGSGHMVRRSLVRAFASLCVLARGLCSLCLLCGGGRAGSAAPPCSSLAFELPLMPLRWRCHPPSVRASQVPQFRPRAALRMLAGVLANEPLAPPAATDKEILAMGDEQWEGALDKWVIGAKAGSDVVLHPLSAQREL